jgi:hypothetical protein
VGGLVLSFLRSCGFEDVQRGVELEVRRHLASESVVALPGIIWDRGRWLELVVRSLSFPDMD